MAYGTIPRKLNGKQACLVVYRLSMAVVTAADVNLETTIERVPRPGIQGNHWASTLECFLNIHTSHLTNIYPDIVISATLLIPLSTQ
jgi:hypothetical protein